MRPLRVVVFGATGTAGSGVMRRCLADDRVADVRAVVRRATGVSHDKLREVRCEDFADLGAIRGELAGVDACFFCLGISQSQAKDEADYRRVTVGYALAAAKALRETSPDHTFVFLSGAGTDATGKSWMMWARVKGEAENQLAELGLRRLFCFRAGYIHPDPEHTVSSFGAKLGRALFPVLRAVMPNGVITSSDLGAAMIAATAGDHPGGVLENREIRALLG